jgi:DNA-binding response OmpR family regulator
VKTLLCVEDEQNLLRNNRIFFEERGYAVLAAENLNQAREHLAAHTPSAIILDIMLPDGNGLEFLRELRARGIKTPVLMLTAWGRNENITQGLRAGANDYISKPFDYEVLLARVETMFRNAEFIPETYTVGSLRFEISPMMAYINGEDMLLTQKDFAALLLFAQHENRVMGAEYIYEKVWGHTMAENDSAVRAAISRLRQKLENSGYTITAKRNEGYCFQKAER